MKKLKILAGILACLMLVSLLPLSAVRAADDTVAIGSAEEFLSFAESCNLDSWSRGKTFTLTADISLDGKEFTPIATFGGTFDGGGHTVSGLAVSGSYAPAGLFAAVQEGAAVRNLNVSGTVAPAGEKNVTGGIVGENRGTVENCTFSGTLSGTRCTGGIVGVNAASGVIRSCTTSGAAFGTNETGGIAGENKGLVTGCTNGMYVNIESTDPQLTLDDLNLDFSLDLSLLTQFDTAGIATDTGGITGYSTGTVEACTNLAAVGYQHIGYNVGGIAGRSSGQIRGCTNEGSICGRKDVGGLVGQMEPYVELQLSESLLSKLKTQLSELSGLIDQASADAEGGAGSISSNLGAMSGYVDSAISEVGNIKVTATVDGSVTGSGSVSSDTTVGAGVEAGVGGGAAGSGSVTVSKGDDGTTVSGSTEAGGGIGAGIGTGAEIDHNGQATGTVDGSAQVVAAPDLGGLTSSLNGLNSQITMLNSAVAGTVGTLANDVREINKKCNELSDTVSQAVADAESGKSNPIVDGSAVDVDTITLGKVSGGANSGTVSGDLNTGGIAGSVSVESPYDPEDDVSSDLSAQYRRQYEYKAVIADCSNTGTVTGKRSYVGGICGRMDLGQITDCLGGGVISSESGNYVGGIAGITGSTVRSCFAKASLSGQNYVGGIVGAGVAQQLSGGSSTVAGCYSMVEITGGTQYLGAVSGADTGEFTDNRFVSDTLAGINRQSYAGKAEPITYEALSAVAGLPESMKQLTLTFVADGNVLQSTTFSYGDSFAADTFPALPQKDGYYARWDHETLENLHFDTVVTAVYTPDIPGLASTDTREDGRSVMLLEGSFDDGVTLTLAAEPQSAGSLTTKTLSDYFSCFRDGKLPAMTVNREVLEQWQVTMTGAPEGANTLRYLPPDGKTSGIRIYVNQGNGWELADCQTFGSYLTFPVTGSEGSVAAVSTFTVWWIWLLAALLILLLVLTVVLLIVRAVRKSKKRKAAAPAPAAPAAASRPQSSEEADLLARAVSAEERLAQVEAELRQLQNGNLTGPAMPAGMPRRKKRWWIPVVIVLVLALAAGAFFFFRSGLKDGLDAYRLLSSYCASDPMTMEMDAVYQADDGASYEQTAHICRTKADGTAVTVLQAEDVTLYVAGDALYLENGRAYALGGDFPDYAALMDHTAELYRMISVTPTVSGNRKTYHIAVAQNKIPNLLTYLMPRAIPTPEVRTLEAELIAENGTLTALNFLAETESGGKLTVQISLSSGDKPTVPDAVLEAIRGGDTAEGITLTEDGFRLVQAWARLYARDSFSADLAVSADCGPIVLHDTLEYDSLLSGGTRYQAIRKGALALYFTDRKVCDGSGNTVSDSDHLVDSARLISLVYTLMLRGTADCTVTDTGRTYTLSLDQDGMAALAAAIAPDSQNQALTFTAGSIVLTMTGDDISSVSLSCTGTVRVVLVDAPVSLGGAITFMERSVSFPQTVLDALK